MPAQSISVTMALDALLEAQTELDEARAITAAKLQTRNALVRDALQAVPYARVARLTGLSREQLARINNSPPADGDPT